MPHTRYCKHRKPVPGRGSAFEECLDCGRQGPISELVSTPCVVQVVSQALSLPVERADMSTPSEPSSPFAVALRGLEGPEEPVNPFGEG